MYTAPKNPMKDPMKDLKLPPILTPKEIFETQEKIKQKIAKTISANEPTEPIYQEDDVYSSPAEIKIKRLYLALESNYNKLHSLQRTFKYLFGTTLDLPPLILFTDLYEKMKIEGFSQTTDFLLDMITETNTYIETILSDLESHFRIP